MKTKIWLRDLKDCTIQERIKMKQLEINNYGNIISRREKMILESTQIGKDCSFLIASTNRLRRELTVAEAELRQLEKGIALN